MDTSRFFQYPAEAPAADDHVFLADCSEADWARLVEHCARLRFGPGEVVVPEGDTDRALLVVLEGRLQTVVGSGRHQRRVAGIPAGSVLGELAFLDGGARAASVIAETDVEVLRLEFDDFERLSRSRPQLAQRILLDLARIVSQRLRRLVGSLAEGPG